MGRGRPNDAAQDLDVLVGLDLPAAQGHNAFEGMDAAQAATALNAAFRACFNDPEWHAPFGGIWGLTAYCNPGSWDIRAIKPYAAWDVSDSQWAVKPPHLPEHSLKDFDPATVAHARAVLAEARAILRMPEPLRSREARDLWEHLHAHRCLAFSGTGEGWTDPGNVDEKWLAYAPGNVLGRVRDLALAKTAAAEPGVWYHGTPDERTWQTGAGYGIHIGTEEAARQALHARIGRPAEGEWDGTREYGKTLLNRDQRSHIFDPETRTWSEHVEHAPPSYPSGGAAYSDGGKIPLDARPNVFPVRIKGPMTNSTQKPHEDFHANGYMRGQLRRGRAKSGYYYTNVSEDEGSVSAVVPSAEHLERVGHEPRTAAQGYWISHRPPGPGATNLDGSLKEKWESVPYHEAANRGADDLVDVYRAVPRNRTSINPGDWVSTHRNWTQERADTLGPDHHVVHARVPARHVWLDASERDDDEAGYHGPPAISPEHEPKTAAWSPGTDLYHGSLDNFPEGTVLTPEDKKEGSSFSGPYVYATTDPEAARYFGSMHDDSPLSNRDVYVHRVEPVGGVEPDDFPAEDERYAEGNYRAKALRVMDSRKIPGHWAQKTAALQPGESQLETREWEGNEGDPTHITRSDRGLIPVAAIANMEGVEGEAPGGHRNRQGREWDDFKADIAANGVREPVFVTKDWGKAPRLSEGNHRRDAAVELGLTHIPAEVRYFGHAERQGLVHEQGVQPKTGSRAEQLEAMDPGSRASAKAQERIRLMHPRTTMPLGIKNRQSSVVLSKWLAQAGVPRAGEAYVTVHHNPAEGISCTGRGPDGEPVVVLHPDRFDYGTLGHEAAHIAADHETGRPHGGAHGEHGPHDDRWAGHYASFLNGISPEAGDEFLAERRSHLGLSAEASAQNPPCHYCGEPLDDQDVDDERVRARRSAHRCTGARRTRSTMTTPWTPRATTTLTPSGAVTCRSSTGSTGESTWYSPHERPPAWFTTTAVPVARPRRGAAPITLQENPSRGGGWRADREERWQAGHLGVHWTDSEPLARGWAEDDYTTGPSGTGPKPSVTHVVLHAASPDREHIEDDPEELERRHMYGFDHPRSEREVPLKVGAPVHLTGISWKHGGESEWNRHDFWSPAGAHLRPGTTTRKTRMTYVTCGQGHEHWGAHGAAGLLIRHRGDDPALPLPDAEADQSGRGSPGHLVHPGRRAAARREPGGGRAAGGRGGGPAPAGRPRAPPHVHRRSRRLGLPHGGVRLAQRRFDPEGKGESDWETDRHGWFTPAQVRNLNLHPGFATSWDRVRKSGAVVGKIRREGLLRWIRRPTFQRSLDLRLGRQRVGEERCLPEVRALAG